VRATAAPPAVAVAQDTVSAHFTRQVVEEEAKYVLQTYGRPSDIVFVKGHGCKLYDAGGKEYLDFAAGIAVNVLGHSDPRWYAALVDQAGRLAHTSNLYHTAPQVRRELPHSLAAWPPGRLLPDLLTGRPAMPAKAPETSRAAARGWGGSALDSAVQQPCWTI
jgi:4-aminobutyrate aminotransferase-like enzyme